MATTQAIRVLTRQKVPFEIREYDHQIKGAEFAAEALDWPLEAMFKTLFVALEDGRFVLACLPGNEELSLKKLARAAGARSARMTRPKEAEKQTGYQVGGISPFGTRKPLPVWLHESALQHERIAINGGGRGVIVLLDPNVVIEVAGAVPVDLGA